jgi:hypothetical protein
MNGGNNNSYNPPSWLPQKGGFQPVNQSDEEVSINFDNGSHAQPNNDSQGGILLVHWVLKIVSILFCGLMLATAIIGVGKFISLTSKSLFICKSFLSRYYFRIYRQCRFYRKIIRRYVFNLLCTIIVFPRS